MIQLEKVILLLCTIVLISTHGHSQNSHLTYEMTQNMEVTKEIANETEFTQYQCKDGSILKIGDRIIIGKPSTNGPNFSYLFFGQLTAGSALLTGVRFLTGVHQAEEVVIENILVAHTRMSRKSPLTITLYTKNENSPKSGNNRTIADYEKALQLREVINPKAPLTREQAIAKLKESKDLLDLGIITQSKYDSIKSILTPLITTN